MKKLLGMLVLLFSSFSVAEELAFKGDLLKIHGVWAELYSDSGEIFSYMVYLPEGRFHAFGYLNGNKANYWFANGFWQMKQAQSCIIFNFDSYGMMEKYKESCMTIVSVNDDELVFLDPLDGKTETLKRVSTGYLP